jgi:type IV secretory pathway VirB3-like protein
VTGDDRYLPARDKGPVKRFCRDFVDSRRTPAEYLLPYFLVIFIVMTIPMPQVQIIATYLWLVAIIVVPIDLIFMGRRLKRQLRERFPNDSHRGAVAYGVMRATQIRRLRMPKPQVKPGETI